MTDNLSTSDRALALFYGALCHVSFLLGVGAMILGLYGGLRSGLGPFEGWGAVAANAALVLQFPLLHSLLLSQRGRRWLACVAPSRLRRPLGTTLFATFASLQLLSVFLLWSPSGVVLFEPAGGLEFALQVAYGLSWVLVVWTMSDAGLGTQLGYLGWLAAARGRQPVYPSFPRRRSFRVCRQPIYLAFALTLWTGPVWTPDHVVVALIWTGYCVLGPILKERRYADRYGEAFRRYQAEVPFFPGRRLGPVR